jgi:hypothetical protein
MTVSPADGVPGRAVTRGRFTFVERTAEEMVGAVPNTAAPVPVSSVKAEARLALDGVAANVATPVPNPLTPVEIGKPVAFVRVPLVGVPKIGVTRVGDVANTIDPVPVSLVMAAAKLALDGVAKAVATFAASPETPVEIGRPVALVRVPLVGVPNIGVTRVGLVASTNAPVPVSSVIAAARFALDGVASTAATLVPSPDTPVEIGSPVAFVSVPEVGVPRTGVTSVGLVARTKAPVPVSSPTIAAIFAEVLISPEERDPAPRATQAEPLY